MQVDVKVLDTGGIVESNLGKIRLNAGSIVVELGLCARVSLKAK